MQKSHRSGDQGQARRWWCRAFDCEAYKKPLSVTPPGRIGEMFNMPSEVRDLSHEIDHLLALSGVDSVHLLREGIESVGELKCAVESSCSDDSGLTDRGRSVGINRLHPVYESVKVISVRHEPSAENPPVPRHDDRQPYPRSSELGSDRDVICTQLPPLAFEGHWGNLVGSQSAGANVQTAISGSCHASRCALRANRSDGGRQMVGPVLPSRQRP